MKKVVLFLILLLSFMKVTYAEDLSLAKSAKSSILIESSTGEIIHEKNKDERLKPASMTKIMSLILIMEEIEKGNLKLDEIITISSNASNMGGSQIYLETGEKMSVDDLLKAICVGSANDAVVALAERISGSEESFVFKMNEKVKVYVDVYEGYYIKTCYYNSEYTIDNANTLIVNSDNTVEVVASNMINYLIFDIVEIEEKS